jgi:8-oxo-dGTP pyrophosphatase MutT (NUDIX family)
MSKNNICKNCCKKGHLSGQCKLPITSYGMIVFKGSLVQSREYLMIRRKDSFGYIDFIRGKYILNNLEHLHSMFNEMSVPERNNIRTIPFDTLWKMMWGDTNHTSQNKGEEMSSHKKFDVLKSGISIDGKWITIEYLIDAANTSWTEAEWEFPKGRRNYLEKDLECALREFEEETGISQSSVLVVENLMPFEEIFLGSNHKIYKHKFFLGYIPKEENLSNYQPSEVSKMEWKTLDKCLESIRPYNQEKKKMITNVHRVLTQYKLYF